MLLRGAILLARALGAASLHRLPATAPRIRPRAPRVPPPAPPHEQRGNEAKANGGQRARGRAAGGAVGRGGGGRTRVVGHPGGGVQLAGTGILLAYGGSNGADSPVEAVGMLIDYLQALGFPEATCSSRR